MTGFHAENEDSNEVGATVYAGACAILYFLQITRFCIDMSLSCFFPTSTALYDTLGKSPNGLGFFPHARGGISHKVVRDSRRNMS